MRRAVSVETARLIEEELPSQVRLAAVGGETVDHEYIDRYERQRPDLLPACSMIPSGPSLRDNYMFTVRRRPATAIRNIAHHGRDNY